MPRTKKRARIRRTGHWGLQGLINGTWTKTIPFTFPRHKDAICMSRLMPCLSRVVKVDEANYGGATFEKVGWR